MNIDEKIEMLNKRCLSCGAKYFTKSSRGFQCKLCGATLKIKHLGISEEPTQQAFIFVEQAYDDISNGVLILNAKDEVVTFECKKCKVEIIQSPNIYSRHLAQCLICNEILTKENDK